MGLDETVFVARMLRVNLDSGDDTVHPVADGAESIVIERIHALILERTIGLDSIPTLPNCVCAFGDWIQQQGILLAIQKHVGFIVVPVIAQNIGEQRRAQETSRKVTGRANVSRQAGSRVLPYRFGKNSERQG